MVVVTTLLLLLGVQPISGAPPRKQLTVTLSDIETSTVVSYRWTVSIQSSEPKATLAGDAGWKRVK